MTRYLIRVDRRLSDERTTAFPHLFSETQPVQTVLMGNFADPEELSGVLNYLGELGISIIELVRIPDDEAGRWAAPA